MTGDDSLRSRPMAPGERAARADGRRRSSPAAAAACRSRSPAATSCCRSATSSGSPRPRSSPRSCWPGLHAPGRTTVVEPQASRDHTERLLRHLGATVTIEPLAGRRPGGLDRRPARAWRGRSAGAGLRLVGGLPAGRGGARPRARRCASTASASTRCAPACSRRLAAMGARLRQGEVAGRQRRAGDLARAGGGAARRHRRAGGARAAHDRRVSDPRGRRGLRPGHHPAARAGRAARQGERPARRDRGRARRLRRPGRGRRGQPDDSRLRRPAARRRQHRRRTTIIASR